MGYVNTQKVFVEPIGIEDAKPMVEKYHYSHAWTTSKYSFGVYYETDIDHPFLDEKKRELIGVAVYGSPVGRNVIMSISDMLASSEVLELKRLYIHDGYGKNIESYVISRSMNWIKNNDKKIKVIISYSDPEVGHTGTIYQACNFYYQGTELGMGGAKFFKINGSDKWEHPKTVGERYGSCDLEYLKRHLKEDFYMKPSVPKHRYFYILGDKRYKKKLLKNLKHPLKGYPNPNEIEDEKPQKIEVYKENKVSL